jgi:hypothetical protein
MKTNDCRFGGPREDLLMGYVYGESTPAERTVFESHLAACRACRDEVAELRAVRVNLEHWSPPQLAHPGMERFARPDAPPVGERRWWQDVPVWAQTAAALLFLGVAAGAANLDIQYGRDGLSVHTGWMTPREGAEAVSNAPAAGSGAPWRQELAALEQRLRSDLQAHASAAQVQAESKPAASADSARQMRVLVAESERKQQRELALRIAEVMHDMQIERQADLVRIERSLGTIQNNTGVEVMRQRQLLNSLAVRVSQRQ